MAEGAGLAFVLHDELVARDEPEAYPRDRGRLYVAVPARGVAAPARLLEHLPVEQRGLFPGKPPDDALSLALRGVMQRFAVGGGNLAMAFPAGVKIVGGALSHTRVGPVFVGSAVIAFVAALAAHHDVGVCGEESRVHQVALVVVFRPNRGRGARSPFTLAAYFGRCDQRLQPGTVSVAGHTGTGTCRRREVRYADEHYHSHAEKKCPLLHITSSSPFHDESHVILFNKIRSVRYKYNSSVVISLTWINNGKERFRQPASVPVFPYMEGPQIEPSCHL